MRASQDVTTEHMHNGARVSAAWTQVKAQAFPCMPARRANVSRRARLVHPSKLLIAERARWRRFVATLQQRDCTLAKVASAPIVVGDEHLRRVIALPVGNCHELALHCGWRALSMASGSLLICWSRPPCQHVTEPFFMLGHVRRWSEGMRMHPLASVVLRHHQKSSSGSRRLSR